MLRRSWIPALLLATPLVLCAADYTVKPLPLPGGSPAGIGMDYIGYHAATNAVWVPAGNTGAVDVIDVATGSIHQISGLPTKEVTFRERKRTVGPSSVTFGDGVAYVGSRADSSVCSFDVKTYKKERCQVLPSSPDGLAYVAPTKEVWVTTPREKSIRILDAATLKEKSKLTFDGSPEGFAVDAKRGHFYTNLEDKDRTVVIDLKTHKLLDTWNPSCGSEGPRGLRADESTGHLFVACTQRIEVMDGARDGAVLSSIDTGAGVDDFDFVPSTHEIYAGAARAGKLTIARVEPNGHLSLIAAVATAEGARNGAVAANGNVYLPHSAASDIVVVSPAH